MPNKRMAAIIIASRKRKASPGMMIKMRKGIYTKHSNDDRSPMLEDENALIDCYVILPTTVYEHG
jgi:hypothetical protein